MEIKMHNYITAILGDRVEHMSDFSKKSLSDEVCKNSIRVTAGILLGLGRFLDGVEEYASQFHLVRYRPAVLNGDLEAFLFYVTTLDSIAEIRVTDQMYSFFNPRTQEEEYHSLPPHTNAKSVLGKFLDLE